MRLLSIFKKQQVNEFEYIREQIWRNIHLVGRIWNKDDIIILRDIKTICVGEFSSYDVYIPTDYISIHDLMKIKHYHVMSISKYSNGLRIHLLSELTINSTTNKQKVK